MGIPPTAPACCSALEAVKEDMRAGGKWVDALLKLLPLIISLLA